MPGMKSRFHLKGFGADIHCIDKSFREGNPQTHGSFTQFEFWKEQFWKVKKDSQK